MADDELGGSALGFDGFKEIKESYREAHARDPEAHLNPKP
jgi:hypothetical protein